MTVLWLGLDCAIRFCGLLRYSFLVCGDLVVVIWCIAVLGVVICWWDAHLEFVFWGGCYVVNFEL